MAEYTMAEAIKKMLDESRWTPRYYASRIRQDWELLVGKTIARYTDSVNLYDGCLTIETTIGPVKQEIQMNKDILKEKINQFYNDQIIREIRIR